MIVFGFLIKDVVYQDDYWKQFLFGVDPYLEYKIISHPSSGISCIPIYHIVAKTEPTTWEKVRLGHYSIFREFLKLPDAQHLIIISESCVPTCTFAHLKSILEPNKSYFTRYGTPWWTNQRGQERWRIVGPEVKDHLRACEHWVILCRDDVQLLVKQNNWVERNFRKCNADSELYISTSINFLKGDKHIQKGNWWHIDWDEGKVAHPNTFKLITPELANKVWNNNLFLRKVNANTNIDSLWDKLKETH